MRRHDSEWASSWNHAAFGTEVSIPTLAKRPCGQPGCPEIVDSGYCEKHKRPSAAKRGYDAQWRKVRDAYLKVNQFCEDCTENGRDKMAKEVHHIVPCEHDKPLFWAQSNWRGLCKACHSKRTRAGER